jgi:O-antigen/teichoic acid export membrane protein
MNERPVSQRVARNGALYFSSLALPAVAAVFLVPVTVHALGPARFGLLALAWAVAEGAGMFDFGLGRATVRFVADATERGADRMKEIILASLFSQMLLGMVAGLLLFFLTPLLVRGVFTIPPASQSEAAAMFRVLALQVPVLLVTSALRAALEGAQRFDLSTALRVPSSLASVAIPAIAASAGASLPEIMWLLLAVRVTLLLINARVVSAALLPGPWALPSGLHALREMLGYSSWVAVSTALTPLLGSFDRFVLGSVIGVTGLGYYTGAAEAANRFLLIPATAFSALLPALSVRDTRGERDRALRVTRAARRQLAALLLPLCLALFVFAPAILGVWLGPAFASKAGVALRILSVGVFFGGLAHLPLALLYGSSRPDLPAKIHISEVVLYVPLTFALVRTFGINGAALAWATRCLADLTLYESVSSRAIGRSIADAAERARTAWLAWATLGLASAFLFAEWLGHKSWPAGLLITALGMATYFGFGWARVITPDERRAWVALVNPASRRP